MASFEIDRQTLKDLDLFNEDGVSVYSFFNNVKTIGGRKKLKELMETPSFDIAVLTSRRDSIRFFQGKKIELTTSKNDVDFIEHYLSFNLDPLTPNVLDAYARRLKYYFSPNQDYHTITQGIAVIRKVLKAASQL